MTETLTSPTVPATERAYAAVEWPRFLVAVLYAVVLVAAPVIVRYAPAPSATPVGVTATAETRHDCATASAAPSCGRAAPR